MRREEAVESVTLIRRWVQLVSFVHRYPYSVNEDMCILVLVVRPVVSYSIAASSPDSRLRAFVCSKIE
jgi:hypothetical protein